MFLSCPFSEAGPCSSAGTFLNGTSGSFSSPNHPLSYPNSKTCRWIISVPEGYKVNLTFNSFNLETCINSSRVCLCIDHVEIRDGNDAFSDELGTFCGDKTPAPILSTGGFMWVEFDTDFSDNKEGFHASYTAVGKGLLLFFLLL